MKRLLLFMLIPFSTLTVLGQVKRKPAPLKKKAATVKTTTTALTPKTTLDSASYAFGLAMATSLQSNGLNTVNYDLLLKGIKDVFSDSTPLISKEASQTVISNAFNEVSKAKFKGNIAEGTAFLENNKKIAGIKTTPSGLQYMVIKEGKGNKPTATDTVLVHYKGTLLNGKQFDSSYDRAEPLSLSLGAVIPGWTEGMQLMEPGAKYRFFIPYNLAYGERGAGQDIPPYSTLIFDIELLKVNGN